MTALHADAQAWDVQPVIPVLTLTDPRQAVALVARLVKAGLPAVEVTLRTSAALDCVRAIAAEVPAARLGVGTVRNRRDIDDAVAAGAAFLVSPGQTDALLHAGLDAPVPFVPGAASASELMNAAEHGYGVVKFFPAEAIGGVKAIAALAAPLPELRLMPTGGINAGNLGAYLALPNVLVCGGSWMVPSDRLAAGDYDAIETLARAAAGVRTAGMRTVDVPAAGVPARAGGAAGNGAAG